MEKNSLVKMMYIYNIIVNSAFSLLLAATLMIPQLRETINWPGFDPLTASLVIPLFVVLAAFCADALEHPERGILILRIQLLYKPFAIGFILFFTISGDIHLFWGILICIGLAGYIAGNALALKQRSGDIVQE